MTAAQTSASSQQEQLSVVQQTLQQTIDSYQAQLAQATADVTATREKYRAALELWIRRAVLWNAQIKRERWVRNNLQIGTVALQAMLGRQVSEVWHYGNVGVREGE